MAHSARLSDDPEPVAVRVGTSAPSHPSVVVEQVLATGEDLTSRTRCHTVVLAGLGDPNQGPTLPVSGEYF